MISEAIKKISEGINLSEDEARSVTDEIMSGDTNDTLIASYLTALSMKGACVDEITGSATSMRNHSTKLNVDFPVTDIVGTGGDKTNSFNISTTSSIVCAAGGVKIAKHGNRASSSKCGAADVLESLGINLRLSTDKNIQLLKRVNFCFLYAVEYHKAMKYVAPVRKLMGIPTIFNILGPLTSPASAKTQLLGVYSDELLEPLTDVLNNLGVKRALTVHSEDGLDEISSSSHTNICELKDGWIKKYRIEPEMFGYKKCDTSELKGGTPDENAEIIRKIFTGSEQGAKRRAVCMNSGAAFYISGKADSIEEGIRLAEKIIDSGKAYKTLCDIIKLSNEKD